MATSTATSATPCTFNKDSLLVRNRQQFEKRTSSNNLLSGSFIETIPESAAKEIGDQPKKRKVGGSIVDDIIHPGNWLDTSAGFPCSSDGGAVAFGAINGWDKDESGSFSIEFRAADDSKDFDGEGESSESDMNSTAIFDPGHCLDSSTPRAHASISSASNSELSDSAVGVPFTSYTPAVKDEMEMDNTDSVQIVFEDSGCKEDLLLDQSLSSSPTRTHTSQSDPHLSNRQSAEGDKPRVADLAEVKGQVRLPYRATIPKVYLYIQMQLCQKETLKDWLSSNTLSRDRMKILHVFDQMLGAVHYVHECGMIHRDLKVWQTKLIC